MDRIFSYFFNEKNWGVIEMVYDVIVDGSNVAKTGDGKATLQRIVNMMKYLENNNVKALFIVSAGLRHVVDQKAKYEKLIRNGVLHQAPAGCNDDEFIIEYSQIFKARIITNDRFQDFKELLTQNNVELIPFMMIDGKVVLSKRN